MERKTFLAAAASVGGAILAAGTAIAAPSGAATSLPTMAPVPGGSGTPQPKPWTRNEWHSKHNIQQVRWHLEHIIDELQHDQHDYAGHRVKALGYLQQARQELLLAEKADTH